MHKRLLLINALALLTFVFCPTTTASAQAPQTWVSGFGNDANTCSRTAPCATFAAALGRTAIKGEINCLDPSGYGAATITKSITIDCEDTQGSTFASGTTGIVINLRAFSGSDPQRIVRLRGITINGTGSLGSVGTRTGVRGISVPSDNSAPVTVIVEQVVIDNFINEGIFFNPAGGELIVRNSVIRNCGASGLMVDSSNPNVIVYATVEGSTVVHNDRGIRGESAVRITASNSNISNNTREGALLATVDASQSDFNLYNCYISSNGVNGVGVDGNTGLATVRLDGNQIVNNNALGGGGSKGVQITRNAQALSRGNNTINGNDINVDGVLGSIPNL